jgi:imidazolonepropionase
MRKLFKNISGLIGAFEPETILKGQELGDVPVIENAFLAIENDKVVGYGSMDDWEGIQDWRNLEVIDASGSFIFPTFCDSHTHLVFAKSREKEFEDRIKGLSYQEIAKRGGGILNSVAKLRLMSEDELYNQASERLKDVISQGTGAIEIKSGYGLDLENELKMLRVAKRLKESFPIPVKTTLLAAHAFPEEYKDNHDGYVKEIIENIIPACANENLADYIDVFCEEGYFTNEQTDLILKEGAKYGLKPKVHVNQFTSSGGLQVAIENNALSVDHVEECTDKDIESLKQSSAVTVALPSCSFFLSIPYTPVRKLIDEGLAIAIATDFNPGSTPSYNMEFLLSLACIKMKLTPIEAIAATTINGAFCMEINEDFGSLGINKKANFILTKEIPSFAYIPYAFGESCVKHVYINGEKYDG